MIRVATLLVFSLCLFLLTACGDDPETEVPTTSPTTGPILLTATPNLGLAPTSTPDPISTPVPTQSPVLLEANFEPDVCQIPEPPDVAVSCGNLVVPEDRRDPNSRMIKLHVAVFRSTSDNPAPDPVVYLSGSPGGSTIETIPFQFPALIEPVLRERDVVVFDQRGTGFSQPSLDCPEHRQAVLDTLDQHLTLQQEAGRRLEAVRRCKERLISEGVDLSAYDTLASAADVKDLREQLGIEEWNIYGVSYGTRLALTAMREHPEGIRSVILDSAVPMEVDLYASFVPNANRAFQKLFDACEASADCDQAYPDLESQFYAAAALLDESPGTVNIFNPLTRQTHDVVVTGHGLVGTVFNAMSLKDFIPLLPEMIDGAAKGEFRQFRFIRGVILGQIEFATMGMHFSVQCAEELPFTTRERVELAADSYPELTPYIDVDSVFDACAIWDPKPEGTLKTSLSNNDIPTLILAGEFDPVAPPEWGLDVDSELLNSHFFEFPSAGHVVMTSGACSLGIALAFLRSPGQEPNGSCIAEIGPPTFTTTGPNQITLVPFQEPAFGIRGVVPEGWVNLGAGVYGETPLALVAIVQQALSTNLAQQVLPTFSRQFGISIPEEADENLELNGLGWNIYHLAANDRPVEVAMSEDDRGVTYFVILTTDPDDRDVMYRNVFLPALDALEAIRPQ